jgi:hypothetical protein
VSSRARQSYITYLVAGFVATVDARFGLLGLSCLPLAPLAPGPGAGGPDDTGDAACGGLGRVVLTVELDGAGTGLSLAAWRAKVSRRVGTNGGGPYVTPMNPAFRAQHTKLPSTGIHEEIKLRLSIRQFYSVRIGDFTSFFMGNRKKTRDVSPSALIYRMISIAIRIRDRRVL